MANLAGRLGRVRKVGDRPAVFPQPRVLAHRSLRILWHRRSRVQTRRSPQFLKQPIARTRPLLWTIHSSGPFESVFTSFHRTDRSSGTWRSDRCDLRTRFFIEEERWPFGKKRTIPERTQVLSFKPTLSPFRLLHPSVLNGYPRSSSAPQSIACRTKI